MTITTTPAAYALALHVEPWTPAEAAQRAATARHTLAGEDFASHGHAGDLDPITRENCAACVLRGYTIQEETGGPAHCQWVAYYVATGRPIPARYVPAFLAEVAEAVANGSGSYMLRDLATFGATLTD